MLHCWKDKADYMYEKFGPKSKEYIDCFAYGGGTCMLQDGHEGNHIFTNDEDILIEVVNFEKDAWQIQG